MLDIIHAAFCPIFASLPMTVSSASQGAVKQAFWKVWTLFVASHQCRHHWLDKSSVPAQPKVMTIKTFSMLLRRLMSFDNDQLGLVGLLARPAWLAQCNAIRDAWFKSFAAAALTYPETTQVPASELNQQAKRRGLAATAAPAAKKARPSSQMIATTNSGTQCTGYLAAINDKLSLRTKTHVQLKITNRSHADQHCRVVVSVHIV